MRLESSEDLSAMRHAVRRACRSCGLGHKLTMELLVVATDVGQDAIDRGRVGAFEVEESPTAVRVSIEQHGFGLAMLDLTGAKRLVDELDVHSGDGHTVITLAKRRHAPHG